MDILFIADPLESFKIYKDSTYAMMREAAKRGHTLYACEVDQISWTQSTGVVANVREITLVKQDNALQAASGLWFKADAPATQALSGFQAVLLGVGQNQHLDHGRDGSVLPCRRELQQLFDVC